MKHKITVEVHLTVEAKDGSELGRKVGLYLRRLGLAYRKGEPVSGIYVRRPDDVKKVEILL